MITVFTPTYNRISKLKKLYDSLLNQTSKNFIWLIVDDGSSDSTKYEVDSWKKEKIINIEYYYKNNGGKASAHNLGVIKSKNPSLFVCVDSDDYLDNNAISILENAYNSIIDNDRIIGIATYKKRIGRKINYIKKHKKYILVSDIYRKYRYKGDMLFSYKSSVLKNNLFPIIDNEKFVPESYLYDKLDTYGKLLLISESPYNYEYLEDGYTNNSKNILKSNPKSFFAYAKNRLEYSKNFLNVLYGAYHYNIACIILKRNIVKYTNRKIIALLLFPLSYFDYKRKYKKQGDRNEK